MKTSLLKKLIALLMATVLLVGIGFTVGATDENAGEAGSGTETTPDTPVEDPVVLTDKCDFQDLVIGAKNVENKSKLHLAFTVDYETEGRIGLYVYEADAIVGVDAPIARIYSQKKDLGGTVYFASQAISTQDIDTQYKFVPVINFGEYLAFGVATTYSVADYCNERLADEGITPEQTALYKLLLQLGTETDKYLAADEEVTE